MMLTLLASMVLCALAIWLLLGASAALLYRGIRPLLQGIDARQGSQLLLAWLAAPPLVAALTCGVLYSPDLAQWLVAGHCHLDSCRQHGPQSATALLPASVLLLWILYRIGSFLHQQWLPALQLGRQLRQCGATAGDVVWLDSPAPAAFTLGWLRPGIFITTGMRKACSPQEIECILQHERAHRLRHDNMRLLVAGLFTAPLPRAWSRAAIADLKLCCEQACDLRAGTATSRLTVAAALLRVARLQQSIAPMGSLAFVSSHTEQRVRALLGEPRAALANELVFTLLGATLLGILLLINPLHRAIELLP